MLHFLTYLPQIGYTREHNLPSTPCECFLLNAGMVWELGCLGNKPLYSLYASLEPYCTVQVLKLFNHIRNFLIHVHKFII